MALGDILGTGSSNAASITNPVDITIAGSPSIAVADLVVVVLTQETALTASSASDNLGNIYAPQNDGTDTGIVTGRMFYSRVTNAGTLTTVSVATTASTNNYVAAAAVFEGPFSVSPVDANPANLENDVTSPFGCPATGVLSQTIELVVGWLCLSGDFAADPGISGSGGTPNLARGATDNSGGPSLAVAIVYAVTASASSVTPEIAIASGTFNDSVTGTISFMSLVAAPSRETAWPNPQRLRISMLLRTHLNPSNPSLIPQRTLLGQIWM